MARCAAACCAVQVENALQLEGQRIPNMTHPDVPAGDEDQATLLNMVRQPASAQRQQRRCEQRQQQQADAAVTARAVLLISAARAGAREQQPAREPADRCRTSLYTRRGGARCLPAALPRLFGRQVGEQRPFDFPVRDHVALGEALGVLDFEAASEVRPFVFFSFSAACAPVDRSFMDADALDCTAAEA